jgi:hypothetical protein
MYLCGEPSGGPERLKPLIGAEFRPFDNPHFWSGMFQGMRDGLVPSVRVLQGLDHVHFRVWPVTFPPSLYIGISESGLRSGFLQLQ